MFTNFSLLVQYVKSLLLIVSFRVRSLRYATNLYTEFHENQTNDLIADSRSLTDGRTEVVGIPTRRPLFYLVSNA